MADGTWLPSIFMVSHVARYFRMHPSNVRRLIRDGRLQAWRMGSKGSRYRIPLTAVESFVKGSSLGVEWLPKRAAL
jgi:excisionase family DNA binding protein